MAKAYECVLMKPVKITSPFGIRKDPVTGKENVTHAGMDLISSNSNSKREIYAAYDGVVLSTVTNQSSAKTGYGNTIWVRHPKLGYSTFYAHLKEVKVKKGQTVKAGQVIAIMGSTGKSTGPHLHFGIQYIGSSKWQNPANFTVPNDPQDIVVQPVERDENKNQLKVVTSNLRVRREPSTKSDVRGFVKEGKIYNYYGVKVNEGYTWYQIDDIQWIANNGKYLEIYPKKEKEDEKMIEELKKELELEKEKTAQLTEEKEKLEIEKNNLELELGSFRSVYTCEEEGEYKFRIKLYTGEKLYIK